MKAPFPWFGGKSRVQDIVWDRFGNIRNYVEPFAGSLAVLLGRPHAPQIETVNDLDCFISNFWRALQAEPDTVAKWADWPVNEADLHARHKWLVNRPEWREQIKANPDFYDAKIAGWWCWGICQWIGSGWCSEPGWRGRTNAGNKARGIATETSQWRVRPNLTKRGGVGPHSPPQKRPRLASGERGVSRQIPHLSGNSGAAGRGIHASGRAGYYQWFDDLSERLRRVRVCCGDWRRVLGPSPTTCIGTTAVFLDPPYAVDERASVYNEESRDIAHDVRKWAIENGDNPELRIALCGYEGEHAMPGSWSVVAWKANGGFANQKRRGTQGKQNADRERVWFSPHCLSPGLFEGMDNETLEEATA